jgi:hypothetical protein
LQDLQPADRRAPVVPELATLRLALPASRVEIAGECSSARTITLRRPELLADLRRARAERFTNRYEWLALRRRRAQIAARHELEG